jgi:hypothetical protein
MSKKVSIMYGVMRLLAVADSMENHHWQNFKRGYPQYEQIRSEFNAILKEAANKKLKGLDEQVEID